ncbi:MAG: mevalonate kinase [Limisphaerales bacterium]|jgi:glucuronokinase|nr:GHMP kinase [Verrucomicrobiota bacterium]
MIIKSVAYPRAGLVGNPSDGYHGKTISFTFSNFHATVLIYETPELEILSNSRDESKFESIEDLAADVRLNGYYGGIRLLKATIKVFHDYCRATGVQLDERNFTLRYETDIPSRVGLAGSSAIITACLRALMRFYGLRIPKPVQANLILSVENRELDIPAGLQDRVAQVYQGLVYMDFEREYMRSHGYGRYRYLPVENLPPLYIAYRDEMSEGTEVFHNDIRGRYNRAETDVVNAMLFWGDLTDRVSEAIQSGQNHEEVGPLLNSNFDKRKEIYQISQGNLEMVDAARSVGASAKFCGSGGAIVGTYKDEAMYEELSRLLSSLNISLLKPRFVEPMK